MEKIYAKTTGFASQVLQTKDIVVFVPRDLRVIIVKRVSLLSLRVLYYNIQLQNLNYSELHLTGSY